MNKTNTHARSFLPQRLRPLVAFAVVVVTAVACGSSDPAEHPTGAANQALESPPWEEIPEPDPTPTAPFGRIEATAGVDSRGQFTYDIPLWVPEGRAGMAPDISLSYNSGRGNSVLGVGWSLTGESFLHRCGKTVSQDGEADNVDFDEDDNFCLDGTKLVRLEYSNDPPEFVQAPGGQGVFAEYRLERNNNSRVLAFGDNTPTGWVVLTEDLRVHYYESAVGANRYPTLDYATLGWMRNRISDRHGNEIHYDYFNPYFQLPSTKTGLRLEKIEYTVSNTGPYAGTPTREVRFVYDGQRPDPISSWVSGIQILKPVRLRKVEMWTPPVNGGPLSLARSYRIEYDESKSTHRSMLSSIELCDGESACLPATRFGYAAPPEHVASEIAFNMTQFLLSTEFDPPDIFSHVALPDLIVLDTNGDGFDDLLYNDTQYSYWGGTHYLTGRPRLAFSQGLPSLGGLEFPSVVQDWYDGLAAFKVNGPFGGAVDVDQNGKSEWFSLESHGTSASNLARVRYLRELGAGYGQLQDTQNWTESHADCDEHDIECWFNALDFNGDGLPDVINPKHLGEESTLGTYYKWRYLMNDPEASSGRFTEQPIPTIPLMVDWDHQVHIADLDGDGAHDFLEYDNSGDYRRMSFEDGQIKLAEYSFPDLRDSILADVNGDGLKDLVRIAPIESIEVGGEVTYHFGPPQLYFNTGNGFQSSVVQLTQLQLPSAKMKPRPVVADFNNDGRDDILVLTSTLEEGVTAVMFEDADTFLGNSPDRLWLSTGESFVNVDPNFDKLPYLNVHDDPNPATTGITPEMLHEGHMPLALGDFDNNGIIDILALSTNPLTASCETESQFYTCLTNLSFHLYEQVLGQEPHHDRLVEVVDGHGRRDELTYDKHSPHGNTDSDPTYIHDGTSCEYPVKCLKKGSPLVREHVISDDNNPSTTRAWNYRYQGHRADLRGRGDLGFSTITKTDSATDAIEVTTYYQDTYGSQWPVGGVKAYPRAGMIQSRTTTFPMGQDPDIEVVEEYSYDTQWDLDAPWYRVVATEKNVTTREGGVVSQSKTTTYENHEFGNPTLIVEATEGGFQTIVERNFGLNDTYNWLIGQVNFEKVTSITPAPELESDERRTWYDYDLITGQVDLVERSTITKPDEYLAVNLSYDGGGLLTSVTSSDAGLLAPRATSLGYSPDGIYVTQVVNEEGHHFHWAFDPAHDGVIRAADENDAITKVFYDGLGRETSVKGPDGSVTSTSYVSSAPMAVERTFAGGGWESTHVDAFDRPVKQEAMLGIDATKTMVRTQYDAAGRLWKRSIPVASGSPVGDGWESYEYDAMGRPTRTVRPGPAPAAVVTWEYPDLYTVVETNEVGNQITRVFSPDRLPVSASVQVGSATEVTTFGYAPFENVDWIEDPAGNVTTMKYDDLGRRTFLGDPNTGDVYEAYNAFGELREQIDAKGNTRTFTYDRLGRMLTRSTEDGTDVFVYDVGLGNLGRPHMAQSADGVVIAYHHDALGRAIGRTYTYGGEQFSVDQSYDIYGRPSTTTYPITASGFQLTTQRNYNPTTGQLASITDGSTTLWAATDRDVAGRVSLASLGSDLTVETTYTQENQRLKSRIVKDDVLGIAVTRLNLNYSYFDNGQIETRNAFGVAETFTYDERGRVDTWSRAHNGVTRTWGYDFDTAGNLAQVSTTASGGSIPPTVEVLTYPPAQSARPHAVQTKGSQGYVYDDDGRLEARTLNGVTDRTFSYNSHNLPKAGWSNGVTFSVAYDAHGQRFRKDSTIETTYVAGIYERRRDGATESHRHLVPLEGGAMAVVTLQPNQQLETRYVVSDDTGTPHIVLNEDGTTDEELFYEPYGARLDADGDPLPTAPSAMSYGLTGHEYDDELGLINMGGRIYDPDVRRFLTPDPFVSGPFSARGLDRYGYVDGDPANRSDPTGFSVQEYTPSKDPPTDPCTDGGCGVDLVTGDAGGATSQAGSAGGVNQGASTGTAAGADGADPNAGQGDLAGKLIDDGFGSMMRNLETAQNVALGVAGTALAIAAIAPAVEAAVVWAAANMGTAGVGTGGLAAAGRRYGATAINFGKGLWRSGAQAASRVASRVGARVSGWTQSWSEKFGRLASDGRGSRLAEEANRASPKCFATGTLIATEDGLMPIQIVEVGDRVWARDEESGEEGWQSITEVIVTPAHQVLTLTFAANDGTRHVLRVTPEHPLWSLNDVAWDLAGQLSLGEQVDSLAGPLRLVVAVAESTQETVYNFEVGRFHTYFVGEAGIWAHNECRALWQITRERAVEVMRHGRFGNFYKSLPDRNGESLWWSRDQAGHGGSAWKVFKEGANGLTHFRDADKYGDFIVGKHKGPVGLEIPWAQLNAVNF